MSINARSSIGDSGFLGHEEQAHDFRRLVETGQLGHAYLFFGDEGIGKFRFACALANFLERGEWRVPNRETLTDVFLVGCGIEETPPRDTVGRTSLGIDTVREMRKFLSSTPFHSVRRTVVIRDVEFLTWEAESALLKMAEEPPAHALIIVIARDPSSLFPPLVSRMARIYFARFSRIALAEILARELEISAREAGALAARSFGRLGYALTLAKKSEQGRDKRSQRESRRGSSVPTSPSILDTVGTASGQMAKRKGEETLAEKLESLILSRFTRGVKKETGTLSFLLARLEAASRFNLNPRLQEKGISYMIGV